MKNGYEYLRCFMKMIEYPNYFIFNTHLSWSFDFIHLLNLYVVSNKIWQITYQRVFGMFMIPCNAFLNIIFKSNISEWPFYLKEIIMHAYISCSFQKHLRNGKLWHNELQLFTLFLLCDDIQKFGGWIFVKHVRRPSFQAGDAATYYYSNIRNHHCSCHQILFTL